LIHNQDEIEKFINIIKYITEGNESIQILNDIIKLLQERLEFDRQRIVNINRILPMINNILNTDYYMEIEIFPQEMARQLSLIEFEMFNCILYS
jgi:hypothetical protein